VSALIPYKHNDLVAQWHQVGSVEEERYEADGTYISGRLPVAVVRDFERFRVAESSPSSQI
ncbi:MAG TPA: hypothetical protein VFT99_14615, partial [Roseiflexaceae bacterium]|nr:hypothetical protein [Roseiflexaceae bacterium]